jgi:cbb3-type cytochrome oxidase subunit 1
MTLPLVVGGALQGVKLLNPEMTFLDASKSALMAFRITSVGEILFAAGAVVFLINVTTVLFKTCCSGCRTTCCDSANLKCAEVKA